MTGDLFVGIIVFIIIVFGAWWIISAKADRSNRQIDYPQPSGSQDDWIMPRPDDADARQAYTSRRRACQNIGKAEAVFQDMVSRAPGMVQRNRDITDILRACDDRGADSTTPDSGGGWV